MSIVFVCNPQKKRDMSLSGIFPISCVCQYFYFTHCVVVSFTLVNGVKPGWKYHNGFLINTQIWFKVLIDLIRCEVVDMASSCHAGTCLSAMFCRFYGTRWKSSVTLTQQTKELSWSSLMRHFDQLKYLKLVVLVLVETSTMPYLLEYWCGSTQQQHRNWQKVTQIWQKTRCQDRFDNLVKLYTLLKRSTCW